MNILRFPSRVTVTRYLDQLLTALVFLAVNVLGPFLFTEADASRLLYESSWALLGAVFAAAGFGTQFMARVGRGDPRDARNVLAGYALAGIVLAAACFVFFALGIGKLAEHAGLIAFGYAWGACDLIRRIALSVQKIALSASLSGASMVVVLTALGIAHATDDVVLVWWISFLGLVPVLGVAIVMLGRAVALCGCGGTSLSTYYSATFKDSATTLASFGLGWLATQGLFATFFGRMNATHFVETKWAFSLLGIFGIALSVQENKYQPIISGAIFRSDTHQVAALVERLRQENLLIGVAALIIIIIAIWIRPGLGLSTCVLLLAYRQSFALSKTEIYLLRAHGRFGGIMVLNATACAVGYVAASICGIFGLNPVAWGLAAYGVCIHLLVSWKARRIGH